MKEILIFKESEYPNFLDNIQDSYEEIISKLEKMVYIQPKKYDKYKSSKEEYDIEEVYDKSLPLFSKCMTNCILIYHTIPSQDFFTEEYFIQNIDFIHNNNLTSEKYKEALIRRCHRAYPSLIRDLVFGKYLQEKLPKGYKVISNENLDTKAEIDLLIIGKKKNIGIHLYVDTKRSRDYRLQKNYRQRIDFENVVHVDLPINLSDCLTINNLKLYGENQYKELIELTKKIR